MKLFIVGLILSVGLPSFAGNHGGGGGVEICINGKCITLAEAGFRMADEQWNVTPVEPAVIEEIENINKLLPVVYKISPEAIVGGPKDIRFIDTVDPKTTQQFLDKYKEILLANNGQSYLANLGLVGFTVSVEDGTNKTFLLREKYNSLSTVRSKALILIHESSLRSEISKVDLNQAMAKALRLDGSFVDYLEAKESNDWSKFDSWAFLRNTYAIGWNRDKTAAIVPNIIGDLVHRNPQIQLKDLCGLFDINTSVYGIDEHNYTYTSNCVYSYAKISLAAKFDSRFPFYVSSSIDSSKMGVVPFKVFSRERLLKLFIYNTEPHTDAHENIYYVFTKQNFENLLQQKNLYDDVSEQVIKEGSDALRKCRDQTDRSQTIQGLALDIPFYEPAVIGCATSDSSTRDPKIAQVAKFIHGLSLDIPGKLICVDYGDYYERKTRCHLTK